MAFSEISSRDKTMIPTRKSNTNFAQFKCFTSSWRRQLIFDPRFAPTRICDPIHLFCTMGSKKKKKFEFQNSKIKNKMRKTSWVHWEKNSSHIYFPLHAFYFVCNVWRKKKIQISKFKIRKFIKQKERKRKLAWTSKKKKKNILGI